VSEIIKIVIGYDGSEYADAALDDLRRAGLPQDAQALIVSVAEGVIPPPDSEVVERTLTSRRVASAVARASQALTQAQEYARLGGERVKSLFPQWEVGTEYLTGSPADALMWRGTEWGADLIVVGSQGRSALERIFLGSVSRKVVTEARCSVRVARASAGKGWKDDRPPRIIIGLDGSSCAGTAVEAVAAREWPAGAEARVVTATKPFHMYGETPAMQESRVRVFQDAAMAELSEAGLAALSKVVEGDPKSVLIDEANAWGADCIFVGSRGLSGALQRFFLGSVSTGVVTGAPCPVEVVRQAECSTERAAEEEGAGKLNVSDVMTREVIAVRADTGVQEIARLLKAHHIGGVLVIDDESNVVGMVSEGDLLLKRKSAPYGSMVDAPALFGQLIEPENIAGVYRDASYLTAADVM
jgi:nucleotide-binding universal stress UspA family protein